MDELLQDVMNEGLDERNSKFSILVDKSTNQVLGWCSIGGFESSENAEVYEVDEIDESIIHDSYYLNGEIVYSQDLTNKRIVEEKKVKDIQAGAELMNTLTQRYILTSASDVEAYKMRYLYPEYDVNVRLRGGDRFMYEGKFYKVNIGQDHVSSAEWKPDMSPSLYTEISDPSIEYPEWVMPTHAENSYCMGAKVTHLGHKFISEIDGNTTEPSLTDFRFWRLVE